MPFVRPADDEEGGVYVDAAWASIIATVVWPIPGLHDASPYAREMAWMIIQPPITAAYHWACHTYLHTCPWNIWHGDHIDN